MIKISVENKKGDVLNFWEHPEYTVLVDDGLTPANADIITTGVSTIDGSRFNCSKLQERNIIMKIIPNGTNIEDERVYLYKWFSPKNWVRLRFKTESRDVFIDGYVETMGGNLFDKKQNYQVSVICPYPYFKENSINVQGGSYTTPLFEFPFAISEEGIEFSTYDQISSIVVTNPSDAPSGMIIRMYASDEVINPKIYNRNTMEYLGLNFTMQSGDMVEISTGKGEKHIILERDGVTTNIINTMISGFSWLQVDTGDNEFTFEAVSGLIFLSVQFEFYNIYGGV